MPGMILDRPLVAYLMPASGNNRHGSQQVGAENAIAVDPGASRTFFRSNPPGKELPGCLWVQRDADCRALRCAEPELPAIHAALDRPIAAGFAAHVELDGRSHWRGEIAKGHRQGVGEGCQDRVK